MHMALVVTGACLIGKGCFTIKEGGEKNLTAPAVGVQYYGCSCYSFPLRTQEVQGRSGRNSRAGLFPSDIQAAVVAAA